MLKGLSNEKNCPFIWEVYFFGRDRASVKHGSSAWDIYWELRRRPNYVYALSNPIECVFHHSEQLSCWASSSRAWRISFSVFRRSLSLCFRSRSSVIIINASAYKASANPPCGRALVVRLLRNLIIAQSFSSGALLVTISLKSRAFDFPTTMKFYWSRNNASCDNKLTSASTKYSSNHTSHEIAVFAFAEVKFSVEGRLSNNFFFFFWFRHK